MISFVKFAAVFTAGCIATAALEAKNDDGSTPKPDSKESGDKKSKKKDKGSKTDSGKKTMDIPVEKGHDSLGMHIPYFDGNGKRQMNFTIGVASRLDDNHIRMTDLQIETFNEDGEHEMAIDLPTSIFNTDTSTITTQQHVTIRRADFELTGEAMVFNTRTKQGGLGGNVRMLIYNLQEETGATDADGAKPKSDPQKTVVEPKEGAAKPNENTPQPKVK